MFRRNRHELDFKQIVYFHFAPASKVLFSLTFVVTLIFGVTVGLIVGILSCLLALAEKQRHLELVPMVHMHATEIFLPDKRKVITDNVICLSYFMTIYP